MTRLSAPIGRGEDSMYTNQNFQTKRALKDAVAQGHSVGIFQPGPFGGNEPLNGEVSVEGPHYPQPHKWYARVEVRDGVIVKVR